MEDRSIVEISQVGHIFAFFVFRWVDLSNQVFLEILSLLLPIDSGGNFVGSTQFSNICFVESVFIFRHEISGFLTDRDFFVCLIGAKFKEKENFLLVKF